MKHLHEKNEQFLTPNKDILDVFTKKYRAPITITLHQREFTSLCPLTGQPDYGEVFITYKPTDKCLESKSLKLYLSAFRGVKGFGEDLAGRIYFDIKEVLEPEKLNVTLSLSPRGGIRLVAEVGGEEDDKVEF